MGESGLPFCVHLNASSCLSQSDLFEFSAKFGNTGEKRVVVAPIASIASRKLAQTGGKKVSFEGGREIRGNNKS